MIILKYDRETRGYPLVTEGEYAGALLDLGAEFYSAKAYNGPGKSEVRGALAEVQAELGPSLTDILGVRFLSQYGGFIMDDSAMEVRLTESALLPISNWGALSRTPQGHPVVAAECEGRTLQLLLDTGCCPHAFVPRAIVERMPVVGHNNDEFMAGFGRFSSDEFLTHISVGEVTGPAKVVVLPQVKEEQIKTHYGVDGIIGGFIMSGRTTLIDFTNQRWATV